MFTNMRGLESRLNEIVRTTSKRFSQVDARLQALEQRAVEQTFRPHESTAEIVVASLPTRGQLIYEEIVNRIFNFVGATRFLGDIISIRELKGRGYRRGLLFLFIREFFFYSNIYKYTYKCWSNFRDFISCTGQNTCKKGIY